MKTHTFRSRLGLATAIAAIPCACSSRDSTPATPQTITTASWEGTSWTVESIEGAAGAFTGTWTFATDSTYQFDFEAPGFFSIHGGGTWSYESQTLTVTGVIRDESIVTSGTIPVTITPPNRFSFRDDDGDRWTLRGAWQSEARQVVDGFSDPDHIVVEQGPWEFRLYSADGALVSHTHGVLCQALSHVGFTADNVGWEGGLRRSVWHGSNDVLQFAGTFCGGPATSLLGVYRSSSGSGAIVGRRAELK